MAKVKKELVNLNLRIPKSMGEAIQQTVRNGLYANTSEFVRDSIRKQLEALGVEDAHGYG